MDVDIIVNDLKSAALTAHYRNSSFCSGRFEDCPLCAGIRKSIDYAGAALKASEATVEYVKSNGLGYAVQEMYEFAKLVDEI